MGLQGRGCHITCLQRAPFTQTTACGWAACRRAGGDLSGLAMGCNGLCPSAPPVRPLFPRHLPPGKDRPSGRVTVVSHLAWAAMACSLLGSALFSLTELSACCTCPPAALAVMAPSNVALPLFLAGPISQKMYAMLPCGGIGVSRAPRRGVGWVVLPAPAPPSPPTVAPPSLPALQGAC